MMGEPKFDPANFSVLEAMVGIKTSLTLKLRTGESFKFGDYQIVVSFNEQGLRFADGTTW